MKYARAILVGFAILLLVSGCTPGTLVEIVNNSGQTLTVVSLDTKAQQTVYVLENNQTTRIKVPYKLRIKHGNKTWDYNLPTWKLPPHFREKVPGNWYLEKYQIEKDGTINCLAPESHGPVADPPSQPNGYPLKPS